MGKNQHVIPWGHQQWAVRGEGNYRITSCHPTQKAAFLAARRIAVHQQSDVLVHGRDSEVRVRYSYQSRPHLHPTGHIQTLLLLVSTEGA